MSELEESENEGAESAGLSDRARESALEAAQQAASQEEVAAVKPKQVKKKGGRVDIGSAFAALGLEEDDSAGVELADANGFSTANGHAEPVESKPAQEPADAEAGALRMNGEPLADNASAGQLQMRYADVV